MRATIKSIWKVSKKVQVSFIDQWFFLCCTEQFVESGLSTFLLSTFLININNKITGKTGTSCTPKPTLNVRIIFSWFKTDGSAKVLPWCFRNTSLFYLENFDGNVCSISSFSWTNFSILFYFFVITFKVYTTKASYRTLLLHGLQFMQSCSINRLINTK